MPATGLRQAAAKVHAVPEAWVRASLDALTKGLDQRAARDAGPDRALSGAGARGVLKVTRRMSSGGTTVTGEIVPVGRAYRWVEYGTGPGRPQGGSSPAKQTWSAPVAAAVPTIRSDVRRRFTAAVGGR